MENRYTFSLLEEGAGIPRFLWNLGGRCPTIREEHPSDRLQKHLKSINSPQGETFFAPISLFQTQVNLHF